MKREYITDYELVALLQQDAGSRETSRGEFVTVCPVCKARKEQEEPGRCYDKRKLYIEPTMSCGFCFCCNTVFLDKSGLSKLKVKKEWTPLSIEGPEFISIPYNRPDMHDEKSHQYLIDRCPQLYSQYDLSSLGFYCVPDKVVIKFMLNGDNYYYQLRYLDPEKSNSGMKYYMPVTGSLGKPLYFAFGQYNPYQPTILVEGVFTALVEKMLLPNYNVVAVLGHYLTKFHLDMLTSLGVFSNLFIHMDTVDMSQALKRSIRQSFKQAKVIRNFSNTLDSEELIRLGKVTPEYYRDYLLQETNTKTKLKIQ